MLSLRPLTSASLGETDGCSWLRSGIPANGFRTSSSWPAGFVTDLASVPRWPFVYLLTGDTARAAAVVHDYLYQTHLVARDLADQVFYQAAGAPGPGIDPEPDWRRVLLWVGVRVGGCHAYETGPDRLEQFDWRVKPSVVKGGNAPP